MAKPIDLQYNYKKNIGFTNQQRIKLVHFR